MRKGGTDNTRKIKPVVLTNPNNPDRVGYFVFPLYNAILVDSGVVEVEERAV